MKKLYFTIFCFASTILSYGQSFDTCTAADSATPITVGTYSIGMIDGTDIPDSFCDGIGGSLTTSAEWLKYVPDSDYTVTISSDLPANGDVNTKVNIYTGSCGNLNCVAGDDDSGEFLGGNGYSFLSYIEFNVIAGETYYIVWDRYVRTNGRLENNESFDNFQFQISESVMQPDGAADPFVEFDVESGQLDGENDRAFVDMNGDFLDDLVAIDKDAVHINIQNPNGGRNTIIKNTPTADFEPTWSLSAGDYNADGYNDLMYGATSGVTFMRTNQGGTSGFDSVSYQEFSGPESVYCQRSNFVDVNNDGFLDAFASHDADASIVYFNDGSNNLVYTEGTNLGDYPTGGNYASIWIDFDNDGDLDMFMAKCSGTTDLDRRRNELYMNNGDGTFTDISQSSGLADLIQTWSSAWGDFDNDGDMDIYVGGNDRADHKIMRNNGNRTFTDVTSGSGIGVARRGVDNVAGDINNDGFLDVATNGTILYGNGDLTFNADNSRPTLKGAIGDINNDGFLDLFNGSLYVNQTNSNNWIKIVTIGDQAGGRSNINGIGARVEINTASGTQIRDVQSGTGFRYMSTLNTHFGIGDDPAINFVRIKWPSGVVDQILNPAINQTLMVTEGETLGTDDSIAEQIKIFPNPAQTVINVELPNNIQNLQFSVTDIMGKVVLQNKLQNNAIDVSRLSSGAYILKLISDTDVFTQKIIKN